MKPKLVIILLVGFVAFGCMAMVISFAVDSKPVVPNEADTHTRLSYVQLAKYPPHFNGKIENIEINYISSDGVVQTSRENTEGQIEYLGIGSTNINPDFFEELYNLANAYIPPDELPTPPGVVYDASYGGIRFLVCQRDCKEIFWDADTSESGAPTPMLADAIERVKQTVARSTLTTAQSSQRFIRVEKLSEIPPHYAIANAEESYSGTALADAMVYPYRLVSSTDQNDPFTKRIMSQNPPDWFPIKDVHVVIQDIPYRIYFFQITPNENETLEAR